MAVSIEFIIPGYSMITSDLPLLVKAERSTKALEHHRTIVCVDYFSAIFPGTFMFALRIARNLIEWTFRRYPSLARRSVF
jgi:hypothetical protein